MQKVVFGIMTKILELKTPKLTIVDDKYEDAQLKSPSLSTVDAKYEDVELKTA